MPIHYNMPTPPCPDCGQPMMVVTGRTKDTGELKRTGLCVWCEPGLYPLPVEDEQPEEVDVMAVIEPLPFDDDTPTGA